MASNKQQRVAIAVGFIAGVLAVLHPIRDLRSWWPPDDVWAVLQPPQRLEFIGGVALIVVTLAIEIIRPRST